MTPGLPHRRIRAGSVLVDRDTRDAMNAFLSHMMVTDAFQNVPARLGYGTSNLLEGTNYPLTRLSRNYILLQALYRSNWIARKIIDAVAEDMLKNWVRFDLDMDPARIQKLQNDIRDTGTVFKLLEALKWGRLFGGAAAIMMIEGDEDRLAKPLDLDRVGPGTFKGLIVLDRWSGITPGATINYDLTNPQEFDLPASYQITTEGGGTYEVHHSRVLRFTGRGLPHWEWQAEQRWGISEFEVIYDELKKRDNTSWNIASLIFRANILGMKQKDLNQMISGLGKSAQAQQQFYSILQAQTTLMSNQGLMILPEDGGLEGHSYTFGGVAEMYHEFMLDLCGAAEMPMSRLFGRSASGLAGTNEGDEHAYYELIKQKQSRDLDPVLRKVLPVIAMSSWGKVPKDFDWEYNPVRSMSNEEQAELSSKKTTAIVETFNSGILGRKTTLMELKQTSEETGMYTNITDEMIDEADDEPVGGEGQLGGDPFGGGEDAGSLKDMPGPKEKGLKPAEKKETAPKKNGKKEESKKGKKAKAKDTFPGGAREFDAATEALRRIGRRYREQARLAGEDAVIATGFANDTALEDPELIPMPEADERPPLEQRFYQGFDVIIENPVGSVRSGPGFSVTMTHPYGYFAGTVGADGDGVDVFLGPNELAEKAYIVHTQDPSTGEYDEDKVMLGFDSCGEAMTAFFENYSHPHFFKGVETIFVEDLEEKFAKFAGKMIKAHDAKLGRAL